MYTFYAPGPQARDSAVRATHYARGNASVTRTIPHYTRGNASVKRTIPLYARGKASVYETR